MIVCSHKTNCWILFNNYFDQTALEFRSVLMEVKFPSLPQGFEFNSKSLPIIFDKIVLYAQEYLEAYEICEEHNAIAIPMLTGAGGSAKLFLDTLPYKLGERLTSFMNV